MLPNIFWSRTDYISGAYATKMVAISSPDLNKQFFSRKKETEAAVVNGWPTLAPPLRELRKIEGGEPESHMWHFTNFTGEPKQRTCVLLSYFNCS